MGASNEKLINPKISKGNTTNKLCSGKSEREMYSEQKYSRFLKTVARRTNCLLYPWVSVFQAYLKERPTDIYKLYCKYCKDQKEKPNQQRTSFSIPFLENRFLKDFCGMYQECAAQSVSQELVVKALDEAKIYFMIMHWFEEPFEGMFRSDAQDDLNPPYSSNYQTVYTVLFKLVQQCSKLSHVNEQIKPNLFQKSSGMLNQRYKLLFETFDVYNTSIRDINIVLLKIQKQLGQLQTNTQRQLIGEFLSVMNFKSIYLVLKITYELGIVNIDTLWENLKNMTQPEA